MVPYDDKLAVAIRLCPRGHDGQFELSAKLTHGVGMALTMMAVSRRRIKVEIEEPEPRKMRRCGIMAGSDHVGFSDMVSLQTRMAEAVEVPGTSSQRSGPSAAAASQTTRLVTSPTTTT